MRPEFKRPLSTARNSSCDARFHTTTTPRFTMSREQTKVEFTVLYIASYNPEEKLGALGESTANSTAYNFAANDTAQVQVHIFTAHGCDQPSCGPHADAPQEVEGV